MTDWATVWQEAHDETIARSPSFEDHEYYRSGRASKAWPEKEGPDWWHENGPKFVESWAQWRKHSGLTFAEFPNADGEAVPGIEIECWAFGVGYGGEQLQVLSKIDRVMQDASGRLYIIDLKTGSSTPPWPLQMALNNLCLHDTYGQWADFAGFWSARKGTVEEWTPLARYTEDWMWEQVAKAKAIRDQQLFIPYPNNLCKTACGVRQHCVAMGGTPFFPLDATMTTKEES